MSILKYLTNRQNISRVKGMVEIVAEIMVWEGYKVSGTPVSIKTEFIDLLPRFRQGEEHTRPRQETLNARWVSIFFDRTRRKSFNETAGVVDRCPTFANWQCPVCHLCMVAHDARDCGQRKLVPTSSTTVAFESSSRLV